MGTTSTSRPDGFCWYEIRLQGRLDPRWSTRFDGMTLTTGDGFTLLEGPVVDQAALHGLLHQLRDIGLPLVSVTQVETDDVTRPPRNPDTSTSGA
ncbi:MAG: hypothetical protein ABJA93_12590 [Sporichthyaceae bacterium]